MNERKQRRLAVSNLKEVLHPCLYCARFPVGRGYGGQILDALTRAAFSLGAKEFRASCREQNERSHRLILSRGFRPTGEESCVDPRNGETYTLLHFVLSVPEQGS